jgi:tripartite-type tricarboxylate transporter receptor subunit TctC
MVGKAVVAQVVAFFCLSTTTSVFPQTYPSKPIRVVSQFAAGSGGDVLARMVTVQVAESLGQPLVIDSNAGGGGSIAAERVARATADGYTLLVASAGPLVILPHLVAGLTYDPVRDFTPIISLGESPIVLTSNPSVPAGSLKELISYARANPDKLSYGTSGIASPNHLAMESILQLTQTKMVHVPYKAGAQAALDVAGGQLSLAVSPASQVIPIAQAGKTRILAVLEKRTALLPGVPSVRETVPNFQPVPVWTAFLGPKNLPQHILARLHSEISRALVSRESIAKLSATGTEFEQNSPEAFADKIQQQFASVGAIIKAAGIASLAQ